MAQSWGVQTDSCCWDQAVLREHTKSCRWSLAAEPPEGQSPELLSPGSPGCLLSVQVCCCCALLLGEAWAGQTSPGPALAGAHTADLTVGANLNFQFSIFYFFTEGKAPDISSVFSDTVAFQYSCFQFRNSKEKGKRRGVSVREAFFFYSKAQFF